MSEPRAPHHPRLAGPESSSPHFVPSAPSWSHSILGDDGHGKSFRKMQSQRKDELLAWVPQGQNLLLFTSGQENTQQVKKQSHTGFQPGLGQTKALNISASSQRKPLEQNPVLPSQGGRAGNNLHGMDTAAQTPSLDVMCS